MKTSLHAPALLVALLLASGCASSIWERAEKISSNGEDGRLYVPKLWAPLLPGSVYPNKRAPIPAKGRPAVVVVCPATGKCPQKEILGPLAERGIVVLLFEGGLKEPPKADLLRTRAESKDAPVGWLLISPSADFLRGCMGAEAVPRVVAILAAEASPSPSSISKKIFRDASQRTDAAGSAGASPSSPSPLSKQIFDRATRRVLLEALLGSEAEIPSEGVIEKLYAPDAAGRLPREAYRDAAEWLAGELGAR
ncbi:MAG TPA: hypothetical protein VFZ57_01320 [Thermoanaerobaculia bacterium]|nr:hypothetical protein [Thermoanaerobaculia bacterium]